MAGNRLYFPVQAVLFYGGDDWDVMETSAKDPITGVVDYSTATPADPFVAHGVQDVSLTSNFALTPVFELGQSNVYENTEGIPTVEVTVSKVLDGRALLWHLTTLDAKNPTLSGRTSVYSTFQLGLWPDDQQSCFWAGTNTVANDGSLDQNNTDEVTPVAVITCPKCFPSSLGYTINVTEASTENLTLSGNEKVWARAMQSNKLLPGGRNALVIQDDTRFNTAFADFIDNEDRPAERIAQGYNVMLTPSGAVTIPGGLSNDPKLNGKNNPTIFDKNGALKDPDCSVFPIEIPGINVYGVNDVLGMIHATEETYQPDPNYARIQSVSFNVTLQRNDINALGYKLPVYKSVQMPIQVTTEITVVSTTDDGIQVQSFSSACQNTAALQASTIRLAICNGDDDDVARPDSNGVRIYAGNQNKLTSVSFGQGGTGGGNAQATYSYQSNNIFTVVAKSDPNQNQYDENNAPAPPTIVGGEVTSPGGWWTNRAKWVC